MQLHSYAGVSGHCVQFPSCKVTVQLLYSSFFADAAHGCVSKAASDLSHLLRGCKYMQIHKVWVYLDGGITFDGKMLFYLSPRARPATAANFLKYL